MERLKPVPVELKVFSTLTSAVRTLGPLDRHGLWLHVSGGYSLAQSRTLVSLIFVLSALLAQYHAIGIYIQAGINPFYYYDPTTILTLTGTSTDHAVILVGYNTLSNPPYWILRNSWYPSPCQVRKRVRVVTRMRVSFSLTLFSSLTTSLQWLASR